MKKEELKAFFKSKNWKCRGDSFYMTDSWEYPHRARIYKNKLYFDRKGWVTYRGKSGPAKEWELDSYPKPLFRLQILRGELCYSKDLRIVDANESMRTSWKKKNNT